MKFVYLFINWLIGLIFEDEQEAVVCEIAPVYVYDVVEPKVRIKLEARANRMKEQISQPPQISWKEFKRNNTVINSYFMKGGEQYVEANNQRSLLQVQFGVRTNDHANRKDVGDSSNQQPSLQQLLL